MTAVAEVFAALGDDSRRGLLETLAGLDGGASATTLATPLPVSRQAVERHLRVLERAGLVVAERHGREVRFVVRREQLDESAAWLTGIAEQWERRLLGVKARAEAVQEARSRPSAKKA